MQVEKGGYHIQIATAEYANVAKCRWCDFENRISDRQWNDLAKLYEVRMDSLDTAYIEKWLRRFNLLDLWAELQLESSL